MTYIDVYPECKGCPVHEYCGTMISSVKLCNSYKIMGKSKKGGLYSRLTGALSRLEKQYEEFKAAKQDKPAKSEVRNGKLHSRPFRTYADECKRMAAEIANIKAHISKTYK